MCPVGIMEFLKNKIFGFESMFLEYSETKMLHHSSIQIFQLSRNCP